MDTWLLLLKDGGMEFPSLVRRQGQGSSLYCPLYWDSCIFFYFFIIFFFYRVIFISIYQRFFNMSAMLDCAQIVRVHLTTQGWYITRFMILEGLGAIGNPGARGLTESTASFGQRHRRLAVPKPLYT